MEKRGGNSRIPPFSVVLIMLALSVVGIACLPRLNVQYTPSSSGRDITVSYSLRDASAEIIEAEATSKIEGVLAGIQGSTGVSSVSTKGSGRVTVSFRKGTDMDAARFEVASAIRNIYPSLPSGLSYPLIRRASGAVRRNEGVAISYIIKGDMPSLEIERYAREHILTPISTLKDVDAVSLSGATPFHWVITFDALKAASAGITAQDIASAFTATYANEVLGMTDTPDGMMAVRLAGNATGDFGSIPVKNVAGRVVYLSDLATWRYEEALPSSYFRVNGLNTITLAVTTTENANLITAVSAIKREMAVLEASFPAEISASVAYDSSEYVRDELNKIYLRTGLCVLILLLFVFLVNRSWRYLLIITATLAVNILTAIMIYVLAGLQIHIYTLAGITVSLGIIIDTSIVMADYYGYWRNRSVFPALLAATATTVGALLMVLLLPESERTNLTDFIWVIVINLSLSLVVAYLFIPSLIEFLPIKTQATGATVRRARRRVKRNLLYRKYIDWGLRYRWAFILIFVIGFGIPTCLLPSYTSSSSYGAGDKELTFGEKVVDKIVSWKPYSRNKAGIDKWLSSSFGLFYKAMERSNFYRTPTRKQLYIRAGMLEGCTVNQLNEVVKSMENYLAGFDEIAVFTTSIYNYSNATIVVEFKPEYEHTAFPTMLKSEVTSMAINFGGANWVVYGIDDNSFNNNIVSSYKSNSIRLTGYNYQELMRYADILLDKLSEYARVSGPEIRSSSWEAPAMEFNLEYDFGAMTAAGVNPYAYYGVLSSLLYDQSIGTVPAYGDQVEVVLKSSDSDSYDLWHVVNSPVAVDSLKMTLATVGNVVKRRTGLDIQRQQQSYQVEVCYDFIGSYTLSKKVTDACLDYMNGAVMPVGYKAEDGRSYGLFSNHKDRYAWLIFLIIAVIFVMLSMIFESLKLPLSVIFLIPISFIGLFLTFGLSDFSFDQGGFAALVMLCGIVVNAGIYLITTYQRFEGPAGMTREQRIRRYVKAFSHKIVPIMLTVASTVLGLLPFLSDGPEEVFWFDFAVGTIGGLVFSLIALLFYLPVFAVWKGKK